MPRLTEEQLGKIRSYRRKPDTDGSLLGSVGSAALRYIDRATRMLGLGVGTAVGAVGELIPGLNKWTPDVYSSTPEAMQAFWKQARQGDWDAAIGAYQDEMEAGPGYWGASELAASLIPTGGPFLAGGKLVSSAPRLAGALARPFVPATRAGVGVKRGIETGITMAGKGMRLPWQAEEAVGRLAVKGVGKVAGPVVRPAVRPLVSRFRGRKPLEEAAEEAVIPEARVVPDEVDQILDQARPPIADEGAPLADELLGQPPITPAAPTTAGPVLPITGFPFPEPWNIRPVYKGPQPGVTNIERRTWQEAVEQRRLEGLPESVPDDPRLAAQEARLAKPIATGKKALTDRLDLEVTMGRLDPDVAEVAKKFLSTLPDEYLDDLGSSYVNRIAESTSGPQALRTEVAGTYSVGDILEGRRSPGIINIAKKVVNQSDIGDRAIIHEVAHHLEDFVSSRDARKLVIQWQRDMRNKGESLISEVKKIRGDVTEADQALMRGELQLRRPFLTEVEVNKIRSAYRYKNFEEWFAEVLTDKALRDLYMEVPAYRNIIQKVMDQIRIMAVAARDFTARVLGRRDEAERVYKKLMSGDYSVAERRSLRSDAYRMEDLPTAPTTADPGPAAIGTQLPLTPTAPVAAPTTRALSNLQVAAEELVKAEDMLKQAKKSRSADRAARIRDAEGEIKAAKELQENTLKSESPDEWARYQELQQEEYGLEFELKAMSETKPRSAPPYGSRERAEWNAARKAAGITAGATGRRRAGLKAEIDRVQEEIDDIITGRTQAGPDTPDVRPDTVVPDEQAGQIKAENDPSKGQTPTPGEDVGGVPPKKPRKPRRPGKPRPTPEERAKLIYDEIKAKVAAIGETVSEALLRRHEGAINAAELEATLLTKFGRTGKGGEQRLHQLGLTETRRGREVVKEEAKEVIKMVYRALHAPKGSRIQLRAALKAVNMPDGSVKDLRPVYNELREFADWEQAARIKSDTSMELIEEFDYFYRGWKMPKKFKAAMDAQGGIGWPPAFRKPRKISKEGILYSFDEMMEIGFEPLSWNPYEQWRISRLQGVRYRQQQMLVDILKKTDIAKPTHTMDGTSNLVKDYRVPRIGPAFEGNPRIITNEAGKVTSHTRGGGWQVHKDVARRLENIYGRTPRLPSVEVPGLRRAAGAFGKDITGEVDVQKVVDVITFLPKRAKLFMSLFQQIDFLTRSTIGTWTGMVDQLIPAIRKGDPGAAINAVKHLAVWPKSMRDIVEANLSPNFRANLKKQLLSTEELIPGRPGLHMKGLVENGLSVRDVNIFPGGLDELAKLVAKDTGASGKRVMQMLGDLESATRRGLFEGVYPAAIMTDVKNNLVKIVVREFPDATDDQIMAMVAKMANVKYSTIPASQSLIQNQVARAFLQRVFFSVGESEALLRQGTMAFHGPYKKLWQKHWLAAYMALLATANTIHFASTGKPLPLDRYVPVSLDNYGPLPFGYRTQFASPDLPSWAGLGGRNETRNTIDIVGQIDTVFRVLDPAGFISARESVPVRALVNQVKGTDYFGAPIDEVGPGGIISRGSSLALDLFAPIGPGQTGVDILRERVPAVGELLPPGEERIGTGGQLLQGLGVNVRGEPTPALRDRIARESGFAIEDPNRAGEPVRSWEDLSPRQMQQLRETRPDLLEEEQRRTEVLARRGQEYAVTRVERSTYENDLVSKLDRTADKYLTAPPESASFRPKAAREKVNEARTIFYNELYGTVWDEEKQRFTKGIYKDALEREEPDPGTVDHLLWQYHKLFEAARDPVSGAISFSGEAGQKFDEEEAKFWSGLKKAEAELLLSNIRIQEEKYPESVQRMLDASRYAGSLELTLGAHSVTYYDLESHPVIIQNIRAETGATQAEIDAYLALPYNERDDAAKEEPTKSIKKAYEDASRKNNVLWNAKKLFIDSSPAEWKWAMLEAGYGYQGKGKLEELMFNYLRSPGGTRPNIQYEELYKEALVPSR